MIEAKRVVKRFGFQKALDGVTLEIPNGSIYGLIGSNGAGKSTFLRLLSGVFKQERGGLTIDGEKIYENPKIKERCFTIADDQFSFPWSNSREMAEYYGMIYPSFDMERYHALMKQFGLSEKKRLRSMSKGMRRQSSMICGAASGADYLFYDEAFDGLDPSARQAAKKILIGDVAERGSTVVISSHNLPELEHLCDRIGLLHQGRLLMSSQMDEAKTTLQKLQYVCDRPEQEPKVLFGDMPLLRQESRGKLRTAVIRGDAKQILARVQQSGTIFYEQLPLTLEEMFIIEMEVNGYDPQTIGV